MVKSAFDFSNLGINTSMPGFYNDPAFIKTENSNPSFLNEYNKFVLGRSYTDDYLLNAEKKISVISEILYGELSKTDRKRACIDIAQVLMLILEKEKIWCCMFDGSMTVEYSKDLNIGNTYFHTVDNGDFSVAHAWVSAPPYKIIDLSLYSQDYEPNEKPFIPKYILADTVSEAKIQAIDIISPTVALCYNTSLEHLLKVYYENNPYVPDFIRCFPPVYVQSDKIKLKYIALHAGASDGKLESARCLDFSGRTPFEIYVDIIKPELKYLL
jgi:hypothetical protein